MFQKIRVNIKYVDEPRSNWKLQLGLQKSDLKQEEEEAWSSLKLNLEVQQKGNEIGTKAIDKIYNEKLKEFVYNYHWIQHSLVPNFTLHWPKKARHQIVHVNCCFNLI